MGKWRVQEREGGCESAILIERQRMNSPVDACRKMDAAGAGDKPLHFT